MGLTWPKGDESGKEATFNGERANKWTDAIIPTDKMRVDHLTGAGSPRITQELSTSILYTLIAYEAVHIVSGDQNVTASADHLKWPSLVPYFFIPLSGAQYISARRENDAEAVDVWIAIADSPS